MSRCRTNFHSENEANINKQINMELYASYVYLSMVSSVNYSYIYIYFKKPMIGIFEKVRHDIIL